MCLGPRFALTIDANIIGRDPVAHADTGRRRFCHNGGRRIKGRLQTVHEAVLMDTTHIEGTPEPGLVSGGKCPRHIHIARGIEPLEIGPVALQHTEKRIGNTRDTPHTDFRGVGKG